jgi:hypothetical protein
VTEYCTATQVSNRLKAAGYAHLADDDADTTVESGEIDANITPCIEWAGSLIDYALANHEPAYTLSAARSAGNTFLRTVAVDLACWAVFTNGGRDVPDSFEKAYERAIEMLDRIREDGEIVPGLSGGVPDVVKDQKYVFEIISEMYP